MKAVGSTRTARSGSEGFLATGATLDRAWGAYARAEYRECRDILEVAERATRSKAERASLALVEARCARSQSDLDAWLAAATLAFEHHPDPGSRLEALALRALAFRRAGRLAEASSDLERLAKTLERDPDAMLGMPTYWLAYDAWLDGDFAKADALAQRNVDGGAALAKSIALQGWCEIKRERYARAGHYFMEALSLTKDPQDVDLRLRGSMLQIGIAVASETVDLRLARKIEKEYDAFVWPASMALERFNMLLGLHFTALLEGDIERAWVLARELAVRAPSVATAALGEVLCASSTRMLGDERMAEMLFRRAWNHLRKRRWGSADDEARTALSYFATEAATAMPAEARKAMTMYESLGARENPASSLNRDRRIRASELVAGARIADARGDRDRARTLYKSALELWQILRFDMRAAIVARDLRRLTRDDRYDAAIDTVLARAPKAWIGSYESASHEILDAITPAETLVLGALVEGKSAREIAIDLDRSVHTVNNHTRKIFKAFGVTSRSGVLARCATLGITPKSLGRTG